MKFTEEQAREALRARLTNNGRKTLHMSERSLQKQTEILVKALANDETGLPDFVDSVIEILETMEGDARKKDSDFAKYKEKFPETDPNPSTDPDPKPASDPALKAYEERIAALEQRLAESDKRVSLAQKRKELIAALKEKGVKDDKWIEKLLTKVNLDREFEIAEEVNDLLPLYNAAKANGGSSTPPANTTGGTNQSSAAASIKAAAEIAKRERSQFKPDNQ